MNKKNLGMKISAFVLAFAMVLTLVGTMDFSVVAAEVGEPVSVLRAYNPNNGEHLLTIDVAEYNANVARGYNAEGETWKAPQHSDVQIYRSYNPNSGEHLLVSPEEAAQLEGAGWSNEGLKMFSAGSDGVPIYRVFNPNATDAGSHLYCGKEEATGLVAIGWQWDNNGTPVFYGVEEQEVKDMTAKQSGASTITVLLPEAATGTETFTVARGLIEETVASTEFSSDKKTVTITLDSEIIDAEYTVVSSNEVYKPATFTGEEAVVTNLVFNGTNLIATDNTLMAGAVGVATVDQFGGFIDADLTAENFNAAGGNVAAWVDNDDGTGILMISAPGAPTVPFTLGSEVHVTAVYADSTKLAQATLTVVGTSVVNEILIGDLTLNPNNENYDDLVGKRVTAARLGMGTLDVVNGSAYLLPMMAKDQYGNSLNAAQLNGMLDDTLYVTPTWGLGTTGTAMAFGGFIDYEEVEGAVLLQVMGDGTSYGTGVINFLSTGGFVTTKQIAVAQNEIIDTLSVTVDDLQVGKARPVIIAAKDQYGEAVDVAALLEAGQVQFNGTSVTITDNNGGESTIKITNGTFAPDPDYGVVALGDNGQTTAVITTQSATNKVTVQQKKINPLATPKAVKGLADGVDTVIAPLNPTVDLSDVDNIVFLDSYGEVFDNTLHDIVYVEDLVDEDDYFYTVTGATTNRFTASTGGVIEVSGVPGPGVDTYTIKLYDNTGAQPVELGSKNVKITVAGEAQSYVAGFVNPILNTQAKNNLFTGDVDTDTAVLVVYGVDKSGNKFLVNGYTAALQNNSVAGATLELLGGAGAYAVNVHVASAMDTTLKGNAYVDIYVPNATTGISEVVATATLSCSNELPTPLQFVGFTVTAGGLEAYDLSKGIVVDDIDYEAVLDDVNPVLPPMLYIVDYEGDPVYVIAAVDQYGMLSADYATFNGEVIDDAGVVLDEPGIISVASDALSSKVLFSIDV